MATKKEPVIEWDMEYAQPVLGVDKDTVEEILYYTFQKDVKPTKEQLGRIANHMTELLYETAGHDFWLVWNDIMNYCIAEEFEKEVRP